MVGEESVTRPFTWNWSWRVPAFLTCSLLPSIMRSVPSTCPVPGVRLPGLEQRVPPDRMVRFCTVPERSKAAWSRTLVSPPSRASSVSSRVPPSTSTPTEFWLWVSVQVPVPTLETVEVEENCPA